MTTQILIDHSGYGLQNIGDVAMLQSCVQRLQRLAPNATVSVICHDPARLAELCPGTTPVVLRVPDLVQRAAPRRVAQWGEYALKGFEPPTGSRGALRRWDLSAQAVSRADVVVASGGGYITDAFFWHCAGVLRTLALAQDLGLPTAMFGQGLGPISNHLLRRRARAVLRRLRLITLREESRGSQLLDELGVPRRCVRVTGDDALSLAARASPVELSAPATALGVNLRVTGYTGVDTAQAARAARAIRLGWTRGDALISLPVSRYDLQDLTTTRDAFRSIGTTLDERDLQSPAELAQQIGRCRAIVTTSYHAAVFALAQGIPAVCLTCTEYYDGKFEGLRRLFPEACAIVSITSVDLDLDLKAALHEAAEMSLSARMATWKRAGELAIRADAAYRDFAADVALGSEDRELRLKVNLG